MGDFRVDAAELIELGRLFGIVRDELGRLHGCVGGLRARTLGSDVIDDALNEFADHWRFGLGRMRDRAGFAGEALTAAGRGYQEVDAQLAAGIRQAVAAPPPTGAGSLPARVGS
jgi:hypothetical protein